MPRTRVLKAGFNRGEVDPKLQRRHDLDWYAFSCAKMRNAVPLPHGGAIRGPGTEFKAELEPTVTGEVKAAPFRFSTDQRYLFVFAAYAFHVYKDGALVYSGAGPWGEDQVRELSFAQNLDTMVVSHHDFAPRRIQRRGADTAWEIDELPISTHPADTFGRRTYSVGYAGSLSGEYIYWNAVHMDGITLANGTTTAGSQTVASVGGGYALRVGGRITMSGEGAAIFTILSISADKTSIVVSPAPSTGASQTFAPYEFGPEDVGAFVRDPNGGFGEIVARTNGAQVTLRVIRSGFDFTQRFADGTWLVLRNAWGRANPQGPTTTTTVSVAATAGDESVTVSSVTNISVGDFVEFGGIGNRVFRVTEASGTTLGVSPPLTMPLAAGGLVYRSVGYPGASAFIEGRLVFGGSKALPSTVFASATNDPSDFQAASAEDDDPITYTIIGGEVPAIRHVAHGRHLFFLTDAGPYYVPKSDQQALTPATFSARKTSEHRPSRYVRPIESDGALLFVQDDGLSLRALLYTDTEAAYNAVDLTFDARHLLTGIRDVAVRRSDPTIGSDLLYLVDDDGSMVLVTVERTENVTGFAKRVSRDDFKTVTADGDEIYVTTAREERNLGNLVRRFLERVSFDHLLESSVKADVTTSTLTVTGLGHLDKRTCDVIVDDVYLGQTNVFAGSATFQRAAEASYEIGIPFGEVGDAALSQVWIKTQPVDFGPPNPTLMGKAKRVRAVTLSLEDTRHVRVNNRLVAFRSAGEDALDIAVPLFTGEKRVGGMMGWSLDAQVDITQTEPAPLTLRALALEVSV